MKELGTIEDKMVTVDEGALIVSRGNRAFFLDTAGLAAMNRAFPKHADRWVKMYRRALKAGFIPADVVKFPFLKRVKLVKGGVPLGGSDTVRSEFYGWKDGDLLFYGNGQWVPAVSVNLSIATVSVMVDRALKLGLSVNFVRLGGDIFWTNGRMLVSKWDGGFNEFKNWMKGSRIGKSACAFRKMGLPVTRVGGTVPDPIPFVKS